MSADLSLIAERRAGLAALLGTLLLEEPGPGLDDFVAAVPAMHALARDDVAVRCEYERIFLRGVPLYASAFLDEDQHGGATLGSVVERYDRLGFTEHRGRRWRVAGADHLGLLLRCHGQLCQRESDAWRRDRPDTAVEIVESERALLRDQISCWAPVALDAADDLAANGPYHAVIAAIDAFLREEHGRLRPAPEAVSTIAPAVRHDHIGPARLARLLLAPATCGTWLSPAVMSAAADRIGSPWRRSDTRGHLRELVRSAHGSGELAVLLEPVLDAVRLANTRYQRRADTDSGNAAHWQAWQARVAATEATLERIVRAGGLTRAERPASELLVVTARDDIHLADVVDRIVAELRAVGCTVERRSVDPPFEAEKALPLPPPPRP